MQECRQALQQAVHFGVIRVRREAQAQARIAELHTEIESGRSREEGLAARIAAMRASRFWKLRDRWFVWKRWLRLTTEE